MINKILIASFLAFVATSSFASDFSALDADQDGLVSKDEASVSPTVTQQWDMLDVNQDGNLDPTELAALSVKTPE
jgi:Ca2+-binding EF-hand superfamily protein